MTTKGIFAATAAAFLGVMSMDAFTTSASAHDNWGRYNSGMVQVCKPIYKKVSWRTYAGKLRTKVKFVGNRCWLQPTYAYAPKHTHRDWNRPYNEYQMYGGSPDRHWDNRDGGGAYFSFGFRG